MEMEHGRVVRYRESYTVPKMKSAIDYLEHLNIIEKIGEKNYQLIGNDKLGDLIEKFAKDLGDQVSINIKLKNINDK